MKYHHTLLGALLTLPASLSAQLLVDFNTNQSAGGTPVAGNPADPANAAHQEAGYECYHARHETIADFITAAYNPTFSVSGASTVMMTPSWPNSSANTVQQSIGRTQGQADTWIGNNVNLLRDWIGCDGRTGSGGNGAWDGTTGTPTYLDLTFQGLPAANYEMTTFHHDVENMNSEFTIEVSTDGGATFGTPINGRMTNSLAGGTPAENEILSGTPPNETGGDPADLTSTQVFAFAAGAQDVVLRFTPLPPASLQVHQTFFALNGFHLDQTFSLDDTDGDDLPDAWEDEHFGDNDGTATPTELALQSGSDNADADTLDNEAEFLNGTDPNDEDSDDDNLLDHEEIANLTDPNDPDSDGDTLLDGPEVKTHFTDPNERDSDGDYFFDQNEVAPGGPGTANDPNSFPISSAGLLVDFSSTTLNDQVGVFHDQGRQPYVADHEVDGSVDRSEIYSVPAFGGANVTLTVDFPDTTLNTVKQLIGRGSAAEYDGTDADLARDWIGVDARAAQSGNGTATPTSIRFTFDGVPAGSYLYSSFHHDVNNQSGDFDVLLTDANNAGSLYDSRTMTASNVGMNPGAGQTLHVLPSTFNAVITSNGFDPIVLVYQGVETNATQTSFVGINGFDLITATDSDGDGLTDEYEIENGLDHTVADSGDDEDMDDLTNLEEFQLGTEPDVADTDDDGANDGEEIAAGSNPFVQDTDGDGLLDGPELDLGSDPTNIDSDGDGFLDGTDPDPTDSSNPETSSRLVAYWPLDGTPDDVTTPDLGPNGYDLSLTNMTSANFVTDEGRLAAQFDNGTQTILGRIHSPGEDLPITQHEAYTISMWVKINGTGQNDLRIFSEGSTTNGTPLYNLGTRNDGADGVLDSYIRPVGGPAHEYSDGMPLDGVWRHIAVTGNDHTDTMQVYIDGILDTANITFRSMIGTGVDTTAIGGILRADPSHWVTGLVDDVALWSKILSPIEIADLASGSSPIGSGGLPKFRITEITYDQTTRDTSITWTSLPGRTYSLFMTDDLSDLLKGGDIDDSISDNGASDTNPADGVITYEFKNPLPVDPKRFFSVREN
ncbi:hypothetical protein N9A94_02275 [Akkermansiaceae bacterium]|nr:hypothetical protein [Akkermansiaceae bacterium]